MTDKIEFIDIDGKNYKIDLFPAEVKQLVSTFEIIRGQYNESAVTTAALGDYMNRVTRDIQDNAKAALEAMLRPAAPADEADGEADAK